MLFGVPKVVCGLLVMFQFAVCPACTKLQQCMRDCMLQIRVLRRRGEISPAIKQGCASPKFKCQTHALAKLSERRRGLLKCNLKSQTSILRSKPKSREALSEVCAWATSSPCQSLNHKQPFLRSKQQPCAALTWSKR